MENITRRKELSGKIKQMGQALLSEGSGENDYTVAQSGTIMLLLSKLIVDDEDMFIFSEFCAMFAAKRILEEGEEADKIEKKVLARILLKKKNISSESSNNITPQKKKRGGRKSKDDSDKES